MPKGYWLATYKKIENKYKCLEGNDFPRTVIWEFTSYEAAEKCYNSKEYQEAWSLAKSSTERNLQIVEGV